MLATVRRPALYRPLTIAAAALLMLAGFLYVATAASAHGSTIDPMSRNYGCWKRWGSDFQNPAMATQDPMCWQAWQADPNAMWNWNGLYREGVAGNHQAAVPDGQLCSGGQTGGVRYAALDNPGNWTATNISSSSNFNVTVHDQARHGADYFRIYVTKQGFNPLTSKPRWADLDLVRDTGKILPGAGQTTTDPVLNGVSNTFAVSAPGRTGRHIVFIVWQASHADQSYYWCSDVNFGGTGGGTTPPTNPPTNPPTSPPTSPPTQPPTTPPNNTAGCAVNYTIVGQWSGGFQAEVKVTAGSAGTRSWAVSWTYANGQQISSSWGATVTASGSSITATNVAYNGTITPGGSTTFGFLGSWTGSNPVPAATCTAT